MAQTKRSKSTSSKNKNTKAKKRTSGSKQVQQTNPEVRSEVILILFFVLCVLMLLSCFGVCGAFGNAVSSLLFGLFGYLAYIVPIALFVGVCFYVANRDNMVAVIVGLLMSKHNDKNKGFTKFGRFIGSEKLLKDYDEENNFIDKYSR